MAAVRFLFASFGSIACTTLHPAVQLVVYEVSYRLIQSVLNKAQLAASTESRKVDLPG